MRKEREQEQEMQQAEEEEVGEEVKEGRCAEAERNGG